MKRTFNSIALIFLVLILFPSQLFSQKQTDTTKIFKNTIRFNITNPMLFGEKYNVIGYERILSKQQSISVDIGRFSLPKFIFSDTDSLKLHTGYNDKGFTFAIDYRFYLKRENRYAIPRGVYLGPYYSYSSFTRDNTWSMNTSNITGDINTRIQLNMNLVGAQMGYQFVIKNRISIDMIIFGPGLWLYSLNTELNTTISPEDEALLIENINKILAEKLPGNEIFIDPDEYRSKNTGTSSFLGFRYLIHLGFRF